MLSGRDRALVIAGLAALTVFALTYTLLGIGLEMSAVERTLRVGPPAVVPGKEGVMAFSPAPWSAGRLPATFGMWWMLTVALTVPAAVPLVLRHADLGARRDPAAGLLAPCVAFVAGYLADWAGFSAVIAFLHWAMVRQGMVSATGMFVTHNVLSGAILVGPGLFQLSRLKHAFLANCRQPGRLLSERFRPGLAGAFRMGLGHGAQSLGCCGFLMVLLFFGGVLNLYWIAGIALLILVERLVPRGESIGLGVGSVLVLWGVLFLVSATGVL